LTPFHRAALRQAPPSLRARLALRVARSMVHATSRSTRTVVRWRQGQATMDLRGSIFCDVRERTAHPLCAYYASAIRHLLARFDLDADVTTEQCRATGGGHCVMSIRLRTGT
jgi:predicted hydrocarbon binding protein